jgi:hypothetical protein
VDAAQSLRFLVDSELLVRALWRELALADVARLVYWNDPGEGDKFFPEAEGLDLIEPQGPAQYLIGGYSDEREWIETEDYMDSDGVINMAAQMFSDGWLDEQVDDFTEETLDLFALAGAAYASGSWVDANVVWTDEGRQALEGDMWELAIERAESEDYDTKVTVVDSSFSKIGYGETSDSQKTWLTEMIRQSRSDPMVSSWGLADHFLMCIALHPATPQSIRDQLLVDSSEGVRDAARVAMERSSPG